MRSSESSSAPAAERVTVLRIIARLNIGGPARHAAILSDNLTPLGFDTVLVHGATADAEASFEDLVRGARHRTIKLPELGRRVRPWRDVWVLAELVRLMRRERPDVVHTHTAKAGALGRAAAWIYNLGKPAGQRVVVLHTFHGHVLSGYFGRFGSGCATVIERCLARITDRIVVIAPALQRELAERFRVAPPDKFALVPLGLDLDELLDQGAARLAEARSSPAAADFTIGFVGRFAPIKDIPTLMRAFARVLDRAPHARLVLAGDGELRSGLEALAQELGVASRVEFSGWRRDLTALYRSFDVAVLSSRNEGTPVALIEAMAAGCAVVATAVGGVPDVVEDGVTGLLTPANDPSALADALVRCAVDPDGRLARARTARERVKDRYGSARLVADIAALYRAELARRRLQPRKVGAPSSSPARRTTTS